MLSIGASTSNSGRRSTRHAKARLNAVESMILSSESSKSKTTVTKAKKRGTATQKKTAPNSKKKRSSNTSTTSTTGAAKDNATREVADGTENNSDVTGLIRETCLQMIPEIVNNVLNQNRSQEPQTTESDSEISLETDEEEDLRAEALASRIVRTRRTPAAGRSTSSTGPKGYLIGINFRED